MRVRGPGVESKAQIKPEVLEALAEVDTEHPSPHAGPPHAHEDAVSSQWDYFGATLTVAEPKRS